jgi:MoaA/NifB/PqqE/SkfB family radical SAM enzyme
MGKETKKTTQTNFRLSQETIDDLDKIAEILSESGVTHTRTDAIRYSARLALRSFASEKPKRKSS